MKEKNWVTREKIRGSYVDLSTKGSHSEKAIQDKSFTLSQPSSEAQRRVF